MKTCSKCGIEKTIQEFQVRKSAPDGRRGVCAICMNAYKKSLIADEDRIEKNRKAVQRRIDNPAVREEKNRKGREYKALNREKILAYAAEYRAKNADAKRTYNKARYQAKKPEILEYFSARKSIKAEYDRAYKLATKDKHSEQTAKWKRENKDRLKSHRASRKARKLSAEGTHTPADIQAILARQEQSCVYCKACLLGGYHLDHRVPLARGGSNWPDNLQALCRECNVRKWAKMPEEFERQIGYCRQG